MGLSLSRVLLTYIKTWWRRDVSEDRLTITQVNTRSKKTTENGRRENSLPIPYDLIIEIFLRLPSKSIASCRCVSKPWASILCRSDFTELFLTRSSAHPQFLLACETYGALLFFFAPQPQNPDENSSHVVVTHHTKSSFDAHYYYTQICLPVHGLVYRTNIRMSMGKEETFPVIYNVSTGQSLLLPKVKTSRVAVRVLTMLGYDPIDKLFKLLSMTCSTYGVHNVFEEHQVLTLGTRRKHSWRMIRCCRPHHSSKEGICINGVLYYAASENNSSRYSMVACFDVRYEKFRFIQAAETFTRCSSRTLINYNGKLGLIGFESEIIELYVLEDAQKHEWSKHTYVLPVPWQNIASLLYVVGITRTNEIVLAAQVQLVFFNVYYYNIERKTFIKLQIKGMEAFMDKQQVCIFLEHVEDLRLMQLF